MTIDVQNRILADDISKWIAIDGKRILEVGCGNGDLLKYIAEYYSPELILGIDSGLERWWKTGECSGDNWKVKSGDAEQLDFPDNSFDAVISISTFEHIGNIEKALSEIKRVLKPYGRCYSSFMPIWTSVIGHHFVASKAEAWKEEHLALIPPWGHLYMTENELRTHLDLIGAGEKLKEKILYHIYHSDIINRIPKREIVDEIHKCGMALRLYSEQIRFSRFSVDKPTHGQSELTVEIAGKILAKGHSLSDVGVAGIKICLEKISAC